MSAVEVQVGDSVPEWSMPSVDPARMKTMAALLRDPYPVHWDRIGNERIGLGARVINQGPLNLGYIANMLIAWSGPASIRRLTVSFGDRVLDGERVTAHCTVTAIEQRGDERVATCQVWLERDNVPVVTGTADVCVTNSVLPPTLHSNSEHSNTEHSTSTALQHRAIQHRAIQQPGLIT